LSRPRAVIRAWRCHALLFWLDSDQEITCLFSACGVKDIERLLASIISEIPEADLCPPVCDCHLDRPA
jgi:hypothetical protein